MFCSNCGQEKDEKANFCKNCGSIIAKNTETYKTRVDPIMTIPVQCKAML